MLKLRYCCIIMMSILFITHAFALDYQAEREAALIGRPWYSNAFIPSSEEIKATYDREALSHIKIRLPLDFERIIKEYHEEKNLLQLLCLVATKNYRGVLISLVNIMTLASLNLWILFM